jgi:hypothetical protein
LTIFLKGIVNLGYQNMTTIWPKQSISWLNYLNNKKYGNKKAPLSSEASL